MVVERQVTGSNNREIKNIPWVTKISERVASLGTDLDNNFKGEDTDDQQVERVQQPVVLLFDFRVGFNTHEHTRQHDDDRNEILEVAG